jgi:plastocyanin domain-containing protein
MKTTFIGTITSLGLLWGLAAGAVAQMPHQMPHQLPDQPSTSTEFRAIEQPLQNKIIVTLAGLGLIGLELWWFLLSKPKSRRAAMEAGVQAVTVTVDGGYEPNRIVVQAGQPVRLNFNRKDPSSCLEEVRLPDFHIAQPLPLNQVTAIEFTPQQPGVYEFTCGMNMFRGSIEVQSAATDTATTRGASADSSTEFRVRTS